MAKTRLPSSDDEELDDPHDFVFTPPPKTGLLTVVLCVLNLIAAIGFVCIMMLDFGKRQEWARAVFLRETERRGIPLQEDDAGVSASQAVAPKPFVRPDDLKEAYQGRKAGGNVKEPFIQVEDSPPVRIAPKLLNEANRKDIFGDLPDHVVTLEEEIQRVKGALLQDIAAAVKEIVAAEATPDDKRKKLEKVWLPQATNVARTRKIDNRIRTAEDAELDKLLADAVEQRMLLDILEPVEFTRPGKVAELKSLSLKDLQSKLSLRLENATSDTFLGELTIGNDRDGKKRDAIEKRHNIAFLLFTIAHVARPDGKLLYERGPERVQTVIGVAEFTRASKKFTTALTRLRDAVVDRIQLERVGIPIRKDDALERTGGFVKKHEQLIQRLRAELIAIGNAERDLEIQKGQRDQARLVYEDGEKERLERTADLIVERGRTAKLLKDLQDMQRRLFEAQLELADAAKINEDLDREIRAWARERVRLENLIPAGGK